MYSRPDRAWPEKPKPGRKDHNGLEKIAPRRNKRRPDQTRPATKSSPGMVWLGLVWFGLVLSGMVRSGPVWSGLVCSVLVRSGMVWSGLCWSCLVCSGLVWSFLVWSGAGWSGLVLAGTPIRTRTAQANWGEHRPISS